MKHRKRYLSIILPFFIAFFLCSCSTPEYEQAMEQATHEGYKDGYYDGYDAGYDAGYASAMDADAETIEKENSTAYYHIWEAGFDAGIEYAIEEYDIEIK